VTATLSVAAAQDRFTWVLLTAAAESVAGAVGGVMSGVGVVAVATGEYPPRFPAPSVARTR
jgi:hypothetical protein